MPLMMLSRPAALLAALCVTPAATADLAIASSGQGQVAFDPGDIGELSGITFLNDDQYMVVGDGTSGIGHATIAIDLTTGRIAGTPTIDTQFNLPGTTDNEGIAYDLRDNSVLVSDEGNQSINRFDATNAAAAGSVAVPAVFSDARGNLGLESLSFDAVTQTLWTANEEAFTGDGPRATEDDGTLVRLQRFDSAGDPAGQFAYLTDPHPGDNGFVTAQVGVSDLLALPSGELIVLERGLGGDGFPSYTISLYLVDLDSATDVSAIDDLDGAAFDTAGKTLLHQFNSGFSNFEGIALGPRLDNGDYALLLVSDDGATLNPQELLSLRLSGLALPGDYNADGEVTAADYTVWADTFGSTTDLRADGNGDGEVTAADYTVWADHFGQALPGLSGSTGQAVPEPAGVAAVGLSFWLAAGRRR